MRAVLAAGCCALIAGCSALPAAGPTKSDYIEAGTQPAPGTEPFQLVEINPHAVSILRRRPVQTLRGAFGDYRPSPEQVIGVGDTVQVTIWEAAAGGLFSAATVDRLAPGQRTAQIPEQTVSRDGQITVPYAGRVSVVGRRPREVETAIVERLRGKAIEPQVLVTVIKNFSSTVTVTGDFNNGGVIPINVRGQKVLETIASAGGPVGAAEYEAFVTLIRGPRSVRVPFQTILKNPSENIYVRPGDVLAIVRTPQTYTVVGATGQNAVIPFGTSNLTLEEALAKGGGLLDYRADPEGVFVLRYEPDDLVAELVAPRPVERRRNLVPVTYRLNLRDPAALFNARLFAIRDKDIIYVASAPLSEVQKLFTLINTVAGPAITARAVTR